MRHRVKDAFTTKKNQLMLCRKVINVHCGNNSKHKIRRAEKGLIFYCWARLYVLTTRLWMVIHHFNSYRWASNWFQVIPCGICGSKVALVQVYITVLRFTSVSVIPPIPRSFIHHWHYRSYHLTTSVMFDITSICKSQLHSYFTLEYAIRHV